MTDLTFDTVFAALENNDAPAAALILADLDEGAERTTEEALWIAQLRRIVAPKGDHAAHVAVEMAIRAYQRVSPADLAAERARCAAANAAYRAARRAIEAAE